MIEKTEALVLRVAPFSRTSHVVTWLTPRHGKLATVGKGACRPKSHLLGQYDLFYTCELLFYARERNGLHIIRECSPLAERSAFRTDWRAASCASYMCDLISRVVMAGHHQPEVYDLAVSSLDFLTSGAARPQVLFWFELRLMKTLGLAPQLSKCPSCRRPHNIGRTSHSFFSYARGGILCTACGDDNSGTTRISPSVLAMLRGWQNAASPRAAYNTRCTSAQGAGFMEILGRFLKYHLDILPASRKIAIEVMKKANQGAM